MGLTSVSRSRNRRRGGYRCKDLNCILCGERNREEERRRAERRSLKGWKWLKHFLGLDGTSERRAS